MEVGTTLMNDYFIFRGSRRIRAIFRLGREIRFCNRQLILQQALVDRSEFPNTETPKVDWTPTLRRSLNEQVSPVPDLGPSPESRSPPGVHQSPKQRHPGKRDRRCKQVRPKPHYLCLRRGTGGRFLPRDSLPSQRECRPDEAWQALEPCA